MVGHARWVSASDLVEKFGFTTRHWTRMASAGRVPGARQPFGQHFTWTFDIIAVRAWWEAAVQLLEERRPISPHRPPAKNPLLSRPPPFERINLKKTLASIMAVPPTPKKRPPQRPVMKTRLTMRASLALGLPDVAPGLGRLKRMRCALLQDAGHEAGRGNVVTAASLVALYVVAC